MAEMNHASKNKTGFWIWLCGLIVLLLIGSILIMSALVRHAMQGGPRLSETQRQAVLAIAEFPSLVKRTIEQVTGPFFGSSSLLMQKKDIEKASWVRRFPALTDDGYLLFSGVAPSSSESIIQLIKIADGKVIAEWKPDWAAINDKLTDKKYGAKGSVDAFRAIHPVLLENGDLVFNTGNALVRTGLCESKPKWVADKVFHHSNEMALDGQSIWVPSVSDEYFSHNSWLKEKLRDDSLARVSIDGKVLENHSFSKILVDNGLREFLLGTAGHQFNEDPIHINQISVAPSDSPYWKRGDLLISARHLSSIFLYRPSTGKIIWHQQGPWMNQHSARFIDDHRISIFDNNVFGGAPSTQPFVEPGSINRVFVYDFATKQAAQPYAEQLAAAKPITITEGRAQVLPDGGLFVEETNFGRHLRFTKDGLLWSRVNDFNSDKVGIVSWSRYLTADEVRKPLEVILRKCSENGCCQK